MTHRRRRPGRVLPGVAGAWASIGSSGLPPSSVAAAEGPDVTIYAVDPAAVRPDGRQLIVYMKVGSTDPNLTATLDPVGVARDGFVQRLARSSQYCEARPMCSMSWPGRRRRDRPKWSSSRSGTSTAMASRVRAPRVPSRRDYGSFGAEPVPPALTMEG